VFGWIEGVLEEEWVGNAVEKMRNILEEAGDGGVMGHLVISYHTDHGVAGIQNLQLHARCGAEGRGKRARCDGVQQRFHIDGR